MYRDRLKKM